MGFPFMKIKLVLNAKANEPKRPLASRSTCTKFQRYLVQTPSLKPPFCFFFFMQTGNS